MGRLVMRLVLQEAIQNIIKGIENAENQVAMRERDIEAVNNKLHAWWKVDERRVLTV